MSPGLGGGDQDQQLVPEDPEGAQPQPGHGGGGGQQEPVTEQPRYVSIRYRFIERCNILCRTFIAVVGASCIILDPLLHGGNSGKC